MDKKDSDKIKRKIGVYNIIPNIIWSVICLIPISVFCYTRMDTKIFYSFLVLSILTLLLPKSFFHLLQFGKTISFYKKSGVIFINKFTQNGTVINKIIRKEFPQYRVVSKRNISKMISQSYMFEKFHFSLFSFFILTTLYALLQKSFVWVLIFITTNIIYNMYPILLQQYIRMKIRSNKKSEHH